MVVVKVHHQWVVVVAFMLFLLAYNTYLSA